MTRPARLLHLHSSFSLGGKEARATRLMNLMDGRAHHVILSAMPDALGARDAIDRQINVAFPGEAGAPALRGKPGVKRYLALARYMQAFDLVLSYNWGAMDGVMAHRMLSPFIALPPLIHHEDGFNEDESGRRNWKRTAFRRLALPTAHGVMVPSQLLERIARDEWGVGKRLRLIRNGIDVASYSGGPDQAITGVRDGGGVIVGTVAGLRAVKALPRLVRAFATLAETAQLVIVGEGPERALILQTANEAGVAHRVTMPGFMTAPHRWIGHFDILALSSLSEQAPIAVIEAMAAGLPVASLDVGDVMSMVAEENRPFIVEDVAGLSKALGQLASDAALRRRVGAANQARAAAMFDEVIMVAAFDALYGSALNGRSLFSR